METKDLTAGTWNLQTWQLTGPNNYLNRKPYIQKRASELDPDLFAFQEITIEAVSDLQSSLPGHAVYRGDEIGRNNYSPLFFRQTRFVQRKDGAFYLGPSGENVPAYDAHNERGFPWTLLHDTFTKRDFVVGVIHLDNGGEEARYRGALQIKDEISRLFPMDMPVILLGDWNSGSYRVHPQDPDKSAAYNVFTRIGFMDAYRSIHGQWPPRCTFNNFMRDYDPMTDDPYHTCYIDMILVRNFHVDDAGILDDAEEVESDHHIVTARLSFT